MSRGRSKPGRACLDRSDRALALLGGALASFIARLRDDQRSLGGLAGSTDSRRERYVGIMTSIAVFAFMPYCQFGAPT